MRIIRVLAGSAAVIAAAAGVGLAAAGPASASLPPGGGALAGSWRAFGGNNPIATSSSTWLCESSVPIGVNVVAQVCVVSAADDSSVQPAVIVRNNKATEYDAQASMSMVATNPGKSASYICSPSGVAPNSWSVCFGASVSNVGRAFVRGTAGNSVNLGQTPPVI